MKSKHSDKIKSSLMLGVGLLAVLGFLGAFDALTTKTQTGPVTGFQTATAGGYFCYTYVDGVSQAASGGVCNENDLSNNCNVNSDGVRTCLVCDRCASNACTDAAGCADGVAVAGTIPPVTSDGAGKTTSSGDASSAATQTVSQSTVGDSCSGDAGCNSCSFCASGGTCQTCPSGKANFYSLNPDGSVQRSCETTAICGQLPDLAAKKYGISNANTLTLPKDGTLKINAKVMNLGTTDSAEFRMKWEYLRNNLDIESGDSFILLGQSNPVTLQAGATEIISYTANHPDPKFSQSGLVYLTVDSGKAILELSERNNQIWFPVNVEGSAPAAKEPDTITKPLLGTLVGHPPADTYFTSVTAEVLTGGLQSAFNGANCRVTKARMLTDHDPSKGLRWILVNPNIKQQSGMAGVGVQFKLNGECGISESAAPVLGSVAKKVVKGPNLVGVTQSMVGKTMRDIRGSCHRGFTDIIRYGFKESEDEDVDVFFTPDDAGHVFYFESPMDCQLEDVEIIGYDYGDGE